MTTNNPTDTNQASEDELLKKIDSIMPQCGEIDCATCTKRHKRVLALIRTEKLKLLAEVRERVVGEDEITYANYEDGFFGGKRVTRDKLRESQRIELTQLEAEL